jgi:hypothetical protein
LQSKPKKVIVISDVRSDYIEQAILILKPEKKETLKNDFLLREATAIIENYNKRLPAERVQAKKQKKQFPYPKALIASFVVFIIVGICFLLLTRL